MLIFSKVNSLDSITAIETLSLSNKLIEYVASKAGIPALGLWVLLCNQITTGSVDRASFCQKNHHRDATAPPRTFHSPPRTLRALKRCRSVQARATLRRSVSPSSTRRGRRRERGRQSATMSAKPWRCCPLVSPHSQTTIFH